MAKVPVFMHLAGVEAKVSHARAASPARVKTTAAASRKAAHLQAAILINPDLAGRIEKIRPPVAPESDAPPDAYTRDRAGLPISPSPQPGDATLFEDPADPAKKLYLPRYRLRERNGRYDLGVGASGDGRWVLRAGLERFPPPELGSSVQGATELKPTIAVFIRYGAGPAKAIEKQVDFTEVVEDADGVTVSAHLTLAERDGLVSALQSDAASPRLVVRRAFEVAARVPRRGGEPAPAMLVKLARVDAQVRPIGLTAKPMTMMSMAARPIDAAPLSASIRATGGSAPIRPPSTGGAAPAAELYRTVPCAFDQAVPPDPLVLDPLLHDYFYATAPGAGAAPEFRRIVRPHPAGASDARFHAYFQDGAEPWVFYYLPDQFKLSRGRIEPFLLDMAVRISAPDGSIENAMVTIDYDAEPTVDAGRLQAAAAALAPEIGAAFREKPLELRPLQAKAALALRLPGSGGSELQEMEGVPIDLANGFTHSLTLPIEGFREIYGAAYSQKATSLWSGQVRVETGLSTPEAIPIRIRFADAEGEVLAFREEPPEDGGTAVTVVMRNAIESPVRLSGLPARGPGEAAAPVRIEGLSFDPPLQLEPGAEVRFTVHPADAGPGDPLDVVFDASGIEVLPDPERILPLISDTSVPAEYERQVEVMTLPELLGDPQDPASILLIHVEFKGGVSLKLSAESPAGFVGVRLPLMDLLLNRDVEGRYAFRQQIIRRNGARVEDAEWRETPFGLLVVPFV